jgi:hypothetical protein
MSAARGTSGAAAEVGGSRATSLKPLRLFPTRAWAGNPRQRTVHRIEMIERNRGFQKLNDEPRFAWAEIPAVVLSNVVFSVFTTFFVFVPKNLVGKFELNIRGAEHLSEIMSQRIEADLSTVEADRIQIAVRPFDPIFR